jgi:hypothetical protein
MGIRSPRRFGVAAAAVALLCLPAVALGAFPGSDPHESPRVNTPNDPDFDACESDDPDTPPGDCSTYFEEEFRAFGFSPESANTAPNPLGRTGHPALGTRYLDCDQLDAQGREANVDAYADVPGSAALAECLQISGVRADTAWKYSTGDPGTAVAVLDTGIRWQSTELRDKVRLNSAELPTPQEAGGTPCAGGDCNGDGAFSVSDFADDPRVEDDAGDEEADAILDASDLIAAFSDDEFDGPGALGGVDDDDNGYVDDIAGWDFFDNDNDPYDASSCCSANGHGTGRAIEAAGDTDNGEAGVGMCPDCQVIPLRVWDTFVVPTDNFAMGVTYAADNGASVVEGAVGGLTNTHFARSAFTYADSKGVALMLVSSDINSANHNYPTNYNEAVYVAGAFPDTAPNDTCSGPGGLPGVDLPLPEENLDAFEEGCDELLGLLADNLQITPGTIGQPVTTSFFRNSNLTQYGGKADVVLEATTGSENTGQASGAAALLASFGRETLASEGTGPAALSGNEIRQLMTMTAEDVLPDNTGIIGPPDKASPGWDPHFGYGRLNLAGAMARITNDRGPAAAEDWPCADADETCIPPEAQIDSPDWFAPINVDRVGNAGLPVRGLVAAPHSESGVGAWELEYACGQDALDADFLPIPGGGISGTGAVSHGVLGTLPKSMLTDLADNCDGSVDTDFGRPSGTAAQAPGDAYPEPDPERHAFQLRLTVHEQANPANVGVYRKTLHAYRDDGNLAGWPRPLGEDADPAALRTDTGGEVSPRLYDLDGDNDLDILQATSSGELYALRSDGSPLPAFNGGQPLRTEPNVLASAGRLDPALDGPRESLRVPAIGDIDGDLAAEIVATAGEHVYAWELDGDAVAGFPARLDPDLSDPCDPGAPHPCLNTADRAITEDNHIKRGFFGSPALADLEPGGGLEIVAGAMDQHVYAFDGQGEALDGFPAKVSTDGAPGAEIITTPAIAQLDGEGPPEIVIASNEVAPGDPALPTNLFELPNALLTSSTGFNPVYALHADGSEVDGWPAQVGVAAGDLLPLVLPGHDAAVLDADDAAGDDEVSVSAATSFAITGGSRLVDGDATTLSTYQNGPAAGPDQGPVLNLADYPSVGDIAGNGSPAVLKGGLTLNGAANLLAPNQNLPFNHVQQAWDPATGAPLAGFPVPTDDFQLVSESSVARVGGAAPAHQALVGTGMYQLHAYGPNGAEPAGWPKFAGGWLQASPAVGDADGDGDLDVSTLTREGWSFLWDTGVDACEDSNEEWWTFHHDEHSTANYGHDARPPGSVSELAAERDPGTDDVTLSWKAPGDDWLCGTPAHYRVIASEQEIDEPTDGTVVADVDAADASGAEVSEALTGAEVGDATDAAVLYRDEAGNWGILKTVEIPPVGPDPTCTNVIPGTSGRDLLEGTAGSDRIKGKRGRDRIKSRGGDDCVNGGRGRDRLRGASGDDSIKAGKGRDQVFCGAGDDTAVVGSSDRVRGCETVTRRP